MKSLIILILQCSLFFMMTLPFFIVNKISVLIWLLTDLILIYILLKKDLNTRLTNRNLIKILFLFGVLLFTQLINLENKIFTIIIMILNIYIYNELLPKKKMPDYIASKIYNVLIGTTFISILYIFLFQTNILKDLILLKKYNFKNLTSFFSHRNTLGYYLFISASIMSYYSQRVCRKSFTFLKLFFIIFLLLTCSRTSILSYFIFVLLFKFLNLINQKNKNIKNKSLIISIILLISLINRKFLLEIIEKYLIRKNVGGSGREIIWLEGWQAFVTNPIGYGLNTSSTLNSYKLNFHNTFLNTVIENGLIFLMFLIFLQINILYMSFKNYKKNSKNLTDQFNLALSISFVFYINFETLLLFSVGSQSYFYTLFYTIIKMRDIKYNYQERVKNENFIYRRF